MGRRVKDGVKGTRQREHFRSAGLSAGGMVHQVYRDAFVYDVWGRKLKLFQSSSTAGISWISVKRWLKKHPEAGVLVEKSWPTTLEAITSWVKGRRALYEDLDEEQRKEVEAACVRDIKGDLA
jgi:hypothetical protein